MTESPVFEWLSAALAAATPWPLLAARGTVRLALKKSGLDPATVSRAEMLFVLDRLMPGELAAKGLEDSEELCRELRRRLVAESFTVMAAVPPRPEEVFRRVLGRSLHRSMVQDLEIDP